MTIFRSKEAILYGALITALSGCGRADDRLTEEDLKGVLTYDMVEQRDQEFQKFLDRRSGDRSGLDVELRSLGFRDGKPEEGCKVLEREDRDVTPTVLLCSGSVIGSVGPPKVVE